MQKTVNEKGNYVTPNELAKKLGVSRPTIKKLLVDGVIVGVKDDNGRWKIPRSENDKAIDLHKKGTLVDARGRVKSKSKKK